MGAWPQNSQPTSSLVRQPRHAPAMTKILLASNSNYSPAPRLHRGNASSTGIRMSMLLFLLLFPLLGQAAAGSEPPLPRLPMICNNGTDHQCVCGPEDPATDTPITCEQFIQTRELPVVDMRARHVNLEAQLHTNENYESYFKRRIAQIVSAYCERQVNECPGVTLRLHRGEDARVDEDKSVIYAQDENEPMLTQNNVVLLRVEHEPGNVTRVLFAITKSDKVVSLSDSEIIDPVKVKVILGSQAVPLSRILGGIKLESVRVSRIRRDIRPVQNDNHKLKMMVGIVALFFICCYIIGGVKLYREWRERQAKRRDAEGLAATTTVPNYGTLPKEDTPKLNGTASVKPPVEQNFYTQYQKIDETVSPTPDENSVLSDRQARFMFMCDSSQLPREPTFDSEMALGESMTTSTPPREEGIIEIEEHTPQPSPKTEIEEHTPEPSPKQDVDYGQQEADDLYVEPPPSHPLAPAVVLLPSLSMQTDSPTFSSDSPLPLDQFADTTAAALLRSDSPPFARPRSRRGSRVDEEEINMTELGLNQQPLFTDLVIPDHIQPDHRAHSADAEHWSSSEEEEVDLYYKMSDDEEIKGDQWTAAPSAKPKVEEEEDSEAENEEEMRKEDTEGDAFLYERLREDASPMPPREIEEEHEE